jgi:hypothetical protein
MNLEYTWAGTAISIVTSYNPDGPGIESQRVGRISAPVQIVPGAHPSYYTVGAGSFPGVKLPRRGVVHPHPPWIFVACSRVNFILPYLE